MGILKNLDNLKELELLFDECNLFIKQFKQLDKKKILYDDEKK